MNSYPRESCLAVSAASSFSPMLLLKRQLSSVTTAILALALGSTAAHAVVVDLTIPGNSVANVGAVGTATYTQFNPQSTGTGVFNAFVQISPGGSASTSQAYNTTVNNTFNVGESDQHNYAITLGDVPVINGFRRFVLDVNELSGQQVTERYVSLDQVRVYVGGTANSNTTNLDSGGPLGTLVYALNSPLGSTTNVVALDYTINDGSGSGDMFLLIPDSLFTSVAGVTNSSNVVLYSAFGGLGILAGGNSFSLPAGNYGQSDGFEEWGAPGGSTTVPDGGPTIALLGGALVLLAGISRRGFSFGLA
jgi:hypothetical protein